MQQFLTDALVSQIVQSSACAFVASLGYFLTLRSLDRVITGRWTHFRHEIQPQILSEPVAKAIYYGARNLGVALIWYGCFAAVRTFG